MLIDVQLAGRAEELAAYQKLVKDVFVDQLQYELVVDDIYTDYSLVFVWLIDQQIVGGVRVVLPNEHGLPIESLTSLPDWMHDKVVVEFSRLVMDRHFRRNFTSEERMSFFTKVMSEVSQQVKADYLVIETINTLKEYYTSLGLVSTHSSFADTSLAPGERAILMYRKL